MSQVSQNGQMCFFTASRQQTSTMANMSTRNWPFNGQAYLGSGLATAIYVAKCQHAFHWALQCLLAAQKPSCAVSRDQIMVFRVRLTVIAW